MKNFFKNIFSNRRSSNENVSDANSSAWSHLAITALPTEIEKLTVLDLFSGIAGFSSGLEDTEYFKTVAFCESDKHCRKVIKKHWPNTPTFEDVKKLKKDDLTKAGINNIDVICGGFPCQDISVAGNQKGFEDEENILQVFEQKFTELFDDCRQPVSEFKGNLLNLCNDIKKAGTGTKAKGTRSGLWKEFARIIKEVGPRWVIIENVANLRNQGLNKIIQDLWKIGYACEWHIIPARAVGACHLRERLWIIAYPNKDRSEQGISLQTWNQGKSLQSGGISEKRKHRSANAASNGLVEHERQQEKVQSDRNKGLQREKGQQSSMSRPMHGVDEIHTPNPNMPRLRFSVASTEEKQNWWAKATASFRDWWKVESDICRVDDGLSKELDTHRKERVKQLGNSVVRFIPTIIGYEIKRWESENRRGDL